MHARPAASASTLVAPLLLAIGPWSGRAGADTILYVDATVPAQGDGASWATATRFLADALAIAAQTPGPVEIRVAAGVHRPDESALAPEGSGLQGASFVVPPNTSLRGGFAGLAGGARPDEQDPSLHVTTLSGDIGAPDDPGDNSDVIVTCAGSSNRLIEGVTVSDGRGPNASGLVIDGGTLAVAQCRFVGNRGEFTPTGQDGLGGAVSIAAATVAFTACDFALNHARSGGAVYAVVSAPAISFHGCTFTGNSANFNGNGGGVGGAISANAQAMLVVDCTFSANQSFLVTPGSSPPGGGAVYAGPSCGLTIRDSAFLGNSTNYRGGAVAVNSTQTMTVERCRFVGNISTERDGGAIGVVVTEVSSIVSDCLFADNQADERGGAIAMSAEGALQVRRCTFVDNTSPNGSAIWTQNRRGFVSDSILRGAAPLIAHPLPTIGPPPVVRFCNVEGGYGGTGNQSDNPCFVDALGGDYRLCPTSPCIDRGSTGIWSAPGQLDLDGAERVRSCRVDLGAHEFVGAGTDCDGSGVADGCEELDGLLHDCDWNGRFDECDLPAAAAGDPDCDDNGTVDTCDLATLHRGTSAVAAAPSGPLAAQATISGLVPPAGDATVTIVLNSALPTNPAVNVFIDGVYGASVVVGAPGCPEGVAIDSFTVPQSVLAAAAADGEIVLSAVNINPHWEFQCDNAFMIFDIAYPKAFAPDCDENGVPDECDAAQGFAFDCNADGIPDECQGPFAFAAQSPDSSPFGTGHPASFTLAAHPGVLGSATLTFLCKADISAANENVVVKINGATVGTIYTGAQTDCVNAGSPATLTVPGAALGPAGTDTVIEMIPSTLVDPFWCGPSSFINVKVAYTAINPLDLDADGMIDSCCRPDVNFDGIVDGYDLGLLLVARGGDDPLLDLDRSGTVDGADVALLLGEWGPCGDARR